MFDLSIKYLRDAIAGAGTQYEWRTLTYGAPELGDDDQFVVDVLPVADAEWRTLTLVAQPDVYRNAIITLTDADNSISITVEIKGTDQFDNEQTEVIRRVGNGTKKGVCIWKTVSRIRYKAYGIAGAADRIKVGTSSRLGLPVQIYDTDQVTRFVSDTAGAKVDELAAGADINTEFSWVEAVTTAMDGTKVFWVEVKPDIPTEATSLTVRPRGHVVFTV